MDKNMERTVKHTNSSSAQLFNGAEAGYIGEIGLCAAALLQGSLVVASQLCGIRQFEPLRTWKDTCTF
jgi:GTP:adenosylcobinamide-phosphate guanylyltransferase